ncbi:DNA polymerase III subunit gamma/tau [Bacillus solitudinis]|uniref:DNA polymerase III subunit gamma/tau n=1 Tax=Bacillus solitudinis TaxID=2014074 RepID=UPI000C23DFF4|nr:DNA polymerase III subunit gamma/tau [Bacillus solitudinis]
MSYQALYRVWRPQLLQDVVGQEHITRTLQNALLQEKFSHAYLFSGPRGTGKTSAAKIIAKAINCEKAPVAEPCNECASCKGITSGAIVDVMEIDAASNNGVDEIRDIRDKVKFSPNEVRYKVYIIDEVHMLSTGAFNALLKTLEEPPSHVIFILATTEPHKIPLTIISRCQRFDFKRISNEDIVNRMKLILNHDELQAEDDALMMIARAADGGMRDALSLLDQAISFADEIVNLQDVLAITGAVSQQALADIIKAINAGETSDVLQLLDQILREGKDPMRFIEDFIYYFRDILLFKTAPHAEALLERAKVNDDFKALVSQFNATWLYSTIASLNESQLEMKWSAHPKIFLELALIKLMNQQNSPQNQALDSSTNDTIRQLHSRVQELENKLQQINTNGIQTNEGQQGKTTTNSSQKRTMRQLPQTRVATAQVKELLKEANKQSLQEVTGRWGTVMERIKTQNIPAHAWISDSRPVAASPSGMLLAFQNEMHRDMIDTKFREFLEGVFQETFQRPIVFFTLLHNHWEKLREEYVKEQQGSSDNEEQSDPVVDEAIKLVGSELIEFEDK